MAARVGAAGSGLGPAAPASERGMLDEAVRALAQAPNFAAVTTLGPTGQPETQVMWVDCDEQAVLFNTELHRQKVANLRRDPRVTVMIWDRRSPYHYAEVRGRVERVELGLAARRHIDRLSHKYSGEPFPQDRIRSERVIVRVRPERQRVWGTATD
ncbi:MAG TPA: PPOX class F420-dependent oxidoreductase [Verrucomicrobiae bacterium]|nr:PPOX class F420-dependent oxidoreductase [Verrucomicrobiae bacterium]